MHNFSFLSFFVVRYYSQTLFAMPTQVSFHSSACVHLYFVFINNDDLSNRAVTTQVKHSNITFTKEIKILYNHEQGLMVQS